MNELIQKVKVRLDQKLTDALVMVKDSYNAEVDRLLNLVNQEMAKAKLDEKNNRSISNESPEEIIEGD